MRLMPSFTLAALLASVALVPGGALAEQTGERFHLSLPIDWREVARNRVQGAEVVAYAPVGQDASTWTDMLTVQVFPDMTALPASSFYERTRTTYRETCQATRGGTMQSGLSNGYPSAFWVLGCGRHGPTGVGETSFFRLIQGDHALYLAQRAWRTAPYPADQPPPVPADQQQQAVTLLGTFGVCDPTVPDHPCPAAAPAR